MKKNSNKSKSGFLPDGYDCHYEEMREERRLWFSQGKLKRGNFGKHRIYLNERVLEELERIRKEGKKKNWPRCNLSSLIHDAILEFIFNVEENSLLDPEPKSGCYEIVEDIIKNLDKKGVIKFKNNDLIKYLKENKCEFKNISIKSINNYIGQARAKIKRSINESKNS